MTETKQCPFCAETIQAAAIVCRYCGRDLPQPEVAAANAVPLEEPKATPGSAPEAPRVTKQSCLVALAGIALIITMALAFRTPSSATTAPSATNTPTGPTKIDAFVICEQFMTKQLKAPKTADFPSYIDDGVVITALDSAQFQVRAFVDAQNGFGALIRTKYTCTTRYLGNDQWRLESLTTD